MHWRWQPLTIEIEKSDFKKFHPSGMLGAKLKTAEDLMITKNKLPLITKMNL